MPVSCCGRQMVQYVQTQTSEHDMLSPKSPENLRHANRTGLTLRLCQERAETVSMRITRIDGQTPGSDSAAAVAMGYWAEHPLDF